MRSDRTMRRRATGMVGVALACVAALIPGPSAPAQSAGARPARRDDAAHKQLEQVADAYKALSAYSDHGEFVVAMKLGDKPHRQVRPLRLTFVRPNKLDLDAGAVRLTCDGKTITTVIEPLKKYISAPAPETINVDTFREGPTGAVLFGSATAAPTASPMYVLLNLLAGANADVLLDQMGGTLHDATPDSSKPAVPTLLIDLQEGPDLLLRVDPATKLLSAIEMKIDPKQLARSAPPGQTLEIDQFGWTSGQVSTQVPADRSFAFVAPKGFAPIEGERNAAAAAPKVAQYAVEEKLGKPAPDFNLTLLDGPGKTRTVSKADLAGKVVVISFWATWCKPCLKEMPEIQKLVEHYKAAKKDVVVVSLSEDDEPKEISEVRKVVEKTLAEGKHKVDDGATGRIGLDPSNAVGKAFDVEGFPTLVILDAKGVVQAAHLGLVADSDTPLHKSLATEIDALLEGKSLAGEKPRVKIEQK